MIVREREKERERKGGWKTREMVRQREKTNEREKKRNSGNKDDIGDGG